MTTQEKWEELYKASKRIVTSQNGRGFVSAKQLRRFHAAVARIGELKQCGHRVVDDCDCFDIHIPGGGK